MIAKAIHGLESQNQWHERAQFALSSDLTAHHAAITRLLVNGESAEGLVEQWLESKSVEVEAFKATVKQLQNQEKPDFPMLSVLISSLSQLI